MSPQPIAGIRPVAPEVSLLTVAGELTRDGAGPGSDPVAQVDGLRSAPWWTSGVSWRRAACTTGHPWPGICPTPELLAAGKRPAAALDEVEFRPYEFYVPYACEWVTPEGRAEMRAEVLATIEAQTAWHVSRELWTGDADLLNVDQSTPNETLMSAADPLGVEAVEPEAALALLIAEYTACSHVGGAVLHIPPVLLPNLQQKALITRVGNQLRGPMSTLVSPGPGYPGPGPWGPAGAVASPGRVWVYISGPVEVALAAPTVLPEDIASTFDRRTNRVELWAERRAIHRFDPCCVFAILTDIPNVGPDAS